MCRVKRGLYLTDEFCLYICEIDKISGYDVNLFSDYRKNRIGQIKNPVAKLQSAAAELALIHAMRAYMPQCGFPLQYMPQEGGKPRLCNMPGVYFNLSHSGNLAVCAVSDKPVGVDVQQDRSPKQGLIERCCTAQELELYRGDFMRIWTRKEAVAKADGRGITLGLNTFDVCGDRAECGGKRYRIWDIPTQEGYYISIAKG